MAYNKEQKSVQVITRLFYDDLEDALQQRYSPDVRVAKSYDQNELDGYIKKYLGQKLLITINGQEKEGRFIGKKYEDDYVVCFIEYSGISDIKTFEISNTLLIDAFPEQKNMVHTKINGKKKSFLLFSDNAKGLLNFSE